MAVRSSRAQTGTSESVAMTMLSGVFSFGVPA